MSVAYFENVRIIVLRTYRYSLVSAMKKIIVHKTGVSRLGGVASAIHKG